MLTARHVIISLLVIIFAFATTATPISAESSPIPLSVTKSETVPGIHTRMQIEWEYSGRQDDLHFKLSRFENDSDEPVKVVHLGGLSREYIDTIEPEAAGITYSLEAMDGRDSIIASISFRGLAPLTGGFASVEAVDAPNDEGGKIELRWQIDEEVKGVSWVRIYRNQPGDDRWKLVGTSEPATLLYLDKGLKNGQPYNYMLEAVAVDAKYASQPSMNIVPAASWFDKRKINLLVIAIIVLSAITIYILRSGKSSMYIRKIAGLEAVEEAVGRATEMGRSVLFIPGILDLDDVQTIAGLTILGSVARMTAEYETRLNVPVARSLVMSNGREVVKEAFLSVGKPDFYHDDIVHYVTDEQFGYVAHVDGIMVREKPAACFYMGAFFAESLILAETGNHVGAIQIAGTAMPTQLPFFVAACDYTLIGEELFAASAYLSGDKRQIASLKGQDVGKTIAMVSILVGAILITLASFTGEGSAFWKLSDAFARLFAMNF